MNKILLIVLIFVLGTALGSIITNSYIYINSTSEVPLSNISAELISPYDWISEDDIHVYSDRITIDIDNPEWATFTDTNSMDPVIDFGANALQIVPKSEEDIHLGDIISYESELFDGVIIHRVYEIKKDEEGTYFILKGDNNPEPDPGKVRFNQIRKVLIGIIY